MDSDPVYKPVEQQETSSVVVVQEPMMVMRNFMTDDEVKRKGVGNDGNMPTRVEKHDNPSEEADDISDDVMPERDNPRGETIDISDGGDNPKGETVDIFDDMSSYNNVASDREAIFSSPGSSLSMPEGFETNASTASNIASASSPFTRTEEFHSEVKERNGEATVKKVFILHFTDERDTNTNDIIYKFASHLVDIGLNVTLDLFIRDEYPGNWNIWYETELGRSNLVLCIITKDFSDHLTGKGSSHIKGNIAYNLMNSRDHTFIPVFLGFNKNLAFIPTCLQGFSSYSIPYRDIDKKVEESSEDFKALYSLMTGQNRRKKPKRGQKVILPSKDSVENESRYISLQAIDTPVRSVSAHNKLFMLLSRSMVAEWEPVGRSLGIGEPKLYSIKRNNAYSVEEQAVQMFQQWLMKNGSKATIGALASGIYEAGPLYRNLLDVIIKQQKR